MAMEASVSVCLSVFPRLPARHLPRRWARRSKLYFCQLICLRLVPFSTRKDKEVKLNWLSIFEGDWSLFKCYFPASRRPGGLYICTLRVCTVLLHTWYEMEITISPGEREAKTNGKLSGLENPNTRLLSCFPTLIWLNLSILMITWPEAGIHAEKNQGNERRRPWWLGSL